LFQRFAPDLSPLGKPVDLTANLDQAFANSPDLVATPTGWLLPIHSNHSLGTLALGPTGQVVSSLPVVNGDFGPDSPRLIARPSGGAFLLWTVAKDQASDLFGALLAEGNASSSPPFLVGTSYGGTLLATALGEGLLVAAQFDPMRQAMATVLVSADGASVSRPQPILGGNGYGAGLVATSDGGALLLDGQEDTTWLKLDKTGAVASPPKQVQQMTFGFAGPALVVGDAVVAAGLNTLTTFDANGASLAAPTRFVVDPRAQAPLLARVKSEVVVAWNVLPASVGKFGLARYAPPLSP
jgi:hypothetical protein